jgi:hypothetical protein
MKFKSVQRHANRVACWRTEAGEGGTFSEGTPQHLKMMRAHGQSKKRAAAGSIAVGERSSQTKTETKSNETGHIACRGVRASA